MFHEGDLQSGIQRAVQESKAVLCFVIDGGDKSKDWETILTGEEMKEILLEQAVVLRMEEGSQEAAYLGGICRINSLPTVVIIRNAKLQANLQSAQVDTSTMRAQLRSIFIPSEVDEPVVASTSIDPSDTPASPQVGPEEIDSLNDEPQAQNVTDDVTRYLDLPSSDGKMRLANNAYNALREQTQVMLGENTPVKEIFDYQISSLKRIPVFKSDVKTLESQYGKTRLVLADTAVDLLLRMPAAVFRIQTKTQSTAGSSSQSQSNSQPPPAESQPAAQDTATGSWPPPISVSREPTPNPTTQSTPRSQPSPLATTSVPPTTSATEPPPPYTTRTHDTQRSDYIKTQREREQAQKDERERIKAQIKADREERRRKDKLRKDIEAGLVDDTEAQGEAIPGAVIKPKSTDVRLQVRTFDGSTLRQTFPRTATLGTDIRNWIDESIDGNIPYNLKLILTPLPNRNIEAGEEEQSLSDLGIRGSATLVMVPVKGYVESYTGSTTGGLVGSVVSGSYNIVSGTAGALFGGVRSFLGYGQQATQQPGGSLAGGDTTAEAGNGESSQPPKTMRVRTLADQRMDEDARKKKDHQFYNGNQLNFEPNRKDDDEQGRKKD